MSNNDSGGGCFLWIIDFIFGIFRSKRIKKYNMQARGLDEYDSIPINSLFPIETYNENIIISGGQKSERLYLSEQIIRNAYNASHPVIIIHTANGALEKIIAGAALGTIVSSKSKLFDAFASFEFNEIYQVVTEVFKEKYDIKPAGRYVLQVVYDLLLNMGVAPSFSRFASCPFFKLNSLIASRHSSGKISKSEADKLESLLITGQTECPKIDAFFSDIKAQIDYITTNEPDSDDVVSVLSAVEENKILCIDIKSSTNSILVELIINSLIIAMNRGLEFSLMVDDVSLTNNEKLKNILCQKGNRSNIIVTEDLYSLSSGKDETFLTLIGEADKTVLLSHKSNVSSEKWSKYIGEYDKIEISSNRTGGWSQSSRWGYTSYDGKTETLKREAKIKPEQISYLAANEAIVYDSTTNSLMKAIIS